MPLRAEELVGQFILSRSASHVPEGWTEHRQGAWCLGTHPALPVLNVLDCGGGFIGWLLGYATSPDARLLKDTVRLAAPAAKLDAAALEAFLYEHGGRYAAIFLTANVSRVYLDPLGSLAAVFCADQQIVASSPALVPRSGDGDDNEALVRFLDIQNTDNWFPFGLTPRRSVERVLPNHYVDLETWKLQRHWPVDEIPPVDDTREASARVATILKRQISAVVRGYPVHMGLTSGRDTRLLLACSREHLDRIAFFTIAQPGPGGSLDCDVARRIARRFGLNHRVLSVEAASQEELDLWLQRTGHCVGGLTWRNVRTLKQLDRSRPLLEGVGGELGRSFHWREGDSENSPISASDLLARRRIPEYPEILTRAAQWLRDLPVRNSLTAWSLFYIEQQLGCCWSGPQHYGHTHNEFRFLPFSHRAILEADMGLPTAYKRLQRLDEDVIEGEWPQLLAFPFNAPLGVRGLLYTVEQGLRRRWHRLVCSRKDTDA